jgi:hypothetical protein
MAQLPDEACATLVFSLYIQNIKLTGGNRKFSEKYIPPRMNHLHQNHREKGLDKIPAKTPFGPLSCWQRKSWVAHPLHLLDEQFSMNLLSAGAQAPARAALSTVSSLGKTTTVNQYSAIDRTT